MLRLLPVVITALLLLGYGVAEGLWTDRWKLYTDVDRAAESLAGLPKTIGPWEGEDVEVDPRVIRQAELRGHVHRNYVNRATGEKLAVLAVCGRPGPISVHSPTVCFGGKGFVPALPRNRFHLDSAGQGPTAEFWAERYHQSGAAVPEQFQVYYAWNNGKGWQAADNPRLEFATARVLFKVYIIRDLPRLDEQAENDPIPAFLKLFMAELDRSVFPPASQP